MKTVSTVLLLLAFSAACVFAAEPPKGITASDIAGRPSVFCKVVKEPDPQLLGRWKCLWGAVYPEGRRDRSQSHRVLPGQVWRSVCHLLFPQQTGWREDLFRLEGFYR